MADLKRTAIFALAVAISSCAALSPYERAARHSLHSPDGGPVYCWAPTEKSGRDGCEVRRWNRPLWECVETLRGNTAWNRTEDIAMRKIETCMADKGWHRIWIDGAVLA